MPRSRSTSSSRGCTTASWCPHTCRARRSASAAGASVTSPSPSKSISPSFSRTMSTKLLTIRFKTITWILNPWSETQWFCHCPSSRSVGRIVRASTPKRASAWTTSPTTSPARSPTPAGRHWQGSRLNRHPPTARHRAPVTTTSARPTSSTEHHRVTHHRQTQAPVRVPTERRETHGRPEAQAVTLQHARSSFAVEGHAGPARQDDRERQGHLQPPAPCQGRRGQRRHRPVHGVQGPQGRRRLITDVNPSTLAVSA
ncbi:exported hypothetical protein [Frigoribacterium sp. 9N]|nr:exported hypothetical protein [Frigoribacterium sp. 9N]